MTKNTYIIATHAAFTSEGDIAGPAHAIVHFLKEKKLNYIFIKHPIYGGYETETEASIDGKKVITRFNGFWEKTPFRYIAEGFKTISLVNKYKTSTTYFIGVDPLNSLWGYITKKIGLVQSYISFAPDFSNKRFSNKIVNLMYHTIDGFTAKQADYLWVVSTRIKKVRLEMGINEKKVFIIPNSPFLSSIPKILSKKDSDLILITNLSRGIDVKSLIQALSILKKKGKRYTLKIIIGAGQGVSELKDLINEFDLKDQIILKERIEHNQVFSQLVKSRVGIALYTTNVDWTYYCDPMKVREYFACGLPVIMTDVPGVAEDVQKLSLGIVIKNANELIIAKSIENIFGNNGKFDTYRANVLKYAKKYDLEKILSDNFQKCNLATR